MARLPVDDVLGAVQAALGQAGAAVLGAPPGAGKTTRVPLALIDAPWRGGGRILMLEPRRLAARAAAERLAAQLGERPGGTIGYRIRGESVPGRAVEVVTEGVLTRILQSDPELTGIACVIFDEIHERSINTDLGLALCLEVRGALRPDLRLLAMSATLDTGAVARLMGDVPVIESAGRLHPVETRWLERPWRDPRGRTRLEDAAAALVRRALDETAGDVLVFLPGAGEIRRVASRLAGAPGDIVPLYGALPFRAQQAAIRPPDGAPRRVILATALAETSLTVERVRVVVDAGRARRARVDAGTGLSRLVTEAVSRAEAEQRRGRAGRLGPGVCYRLWTRGEDGALPAFAPPEIAEADLAGLALELAAWGTADPGTLAFLTPPPGARMAAARALLGDLGALDRGGAITAHGRAMAARPLHPRLAHMILTAEAEGLGPEAALLGALLEGREVLAPGAPAEADLVARLRALCGGGGVPLDRGAAARVREDAARLSRGRADPERASAMAGRLLARAYPDRIALRRPGEAPRYVLSGGRGGVLAPGDPLAGQRLLVAADLDDGREARIRRAAVLSEGDLRAEHADALRWVETASWEPRTRRVEARRQERLGALVLRDELWRDAPAEAVGRALGDGIRARGIAALDWTDAAAGLRARLAWLRSGGAALPDASDAALLEHLDTWLTPWLAGLTRIEDIPPRLSGEALTAWLGTDTVAAVDRLAPARFQTPLGERMALDYRSDGPVLAVRVQALFGLDVHPQLGDPPRPLVIELLSPAGRPVQITRDLPGFWRDSYRDVRKDMRARYPRHSWPETPWQAEPSLRARPRKPGTKS